MHAFYKCLMQDAHLCGLFKDMLETALKQEEATLSELAQEALFHADQVNYALSQYGKVDAYKTLLNMVIRIFNKHHHAARI